MGEKKEMNHHKNTNIQCANCGIYGHMYKSCQLPITSHGVICFRIRYDHFHKRYYHEYLMVQRKDSLNYIEFIRGKYDLHDTPYIMKMFENMTHTERQRIELLDFYDLWIQLWKTPRIHLHEKEFKESQYKFDQLKRGFMVQEHHRVDLSYILENTVTVYDEAEWGFPKGRRNINESNFYCALREFYEETRLEPENVQIYDMKPLEENFIGSNKIRYRHLYYVAFYFNPRFDQYLHPFSYFPLVQWPSQKRISSSYIPDGYFQNIRFDKKEIQSIQWFKYTRAIRMIRDHNMERKELFRRLNYMISKNIYLINTNKLALSYPPHGFS